MQLKIIRPKEANAIAKITVHKTGKLGFSKGAMEILKLEENKYSKFGFNEAEDFFIIMCSTFDLFHSFTVNNKLITCGCFFSFINFSFTYYFIYH